MADPCLRRAIGVAAASVGIALPTALGRAGQPSGGTVVPAALGLLPWYPFDRLILAAPDPRGPTDQDRT